MIGTVYHAACSCPGSASRTSCYDNVASSRCWFLYPMFLLDLHRFTTKQSTFMIHKVGKQIAQG